MVFRRRDRRPVGQIVKEFFLPRGGWKRAATYVWHRLRRLPDPPHRIARGIFAGVFISFTPLFGFHYIGAALIAWGLRGNILAALLATFFGNPLTTPLIAVSSVELGYWMLGNEGHLSPHDIFAAMSQAAMDLWSNVLAVFTAEAMQWDGLGAFYHTIFLPYLVGGIGPGILASLACYFVSVPLVEAFQKLRSKKRREQIEKAVARRRRLADKLRTEAKTEPEGDG